MTAAAITVVCPHCKGRMQASSEHIGRKGRCTFCKMLVEIKPSPDESLAMIQPTGTVGIAREADARLSSTNVPAWQAGLLGAAATAVLYLAVFVPLRATEFGKKFLDRGPMQYATTLVTCWGLALLALKHRAVRRQRSYAEQELEFFPLDIALQISPRNVDQFLAHVANQPKPRRLSILGRRIQGALEHFKSRHSVPEVQQYLATQAELDASSVDSGYTLLRSFVWVIPLFGFIGTVQGIGDAVSGLDRSLKSGAGQEQLLAGLEVVTAGLATAFDTTYVALVMAILLLFPTEALRRIEYGMLDRIEAFTNQSLLRRMTDERPPIATEDLPQVVRDTLDAAFREHQRWLVQWQAQVSQLGQLIGRDFESAVVRVEHTSAQAQGARIDEYQTLCRQLEAAFAQARTLVEQQNQVWEKLSDRTLDTTLLRLVEHLARVADRLDAARPGSATEVAPPDVIEPVPDGTLYPKQSPPGFRDRRTGQ